MKPTPEPAEPEILQVRVFGDASQPTLVYLPGLHGDWTLVTSFREAMRARVRFVEMTYPRTLEWSIEDYTSAISNALAERGITRGWLLGESFGSQLVWPLIERSVARRGMHVEGVVLSAGFVKHPWTAGPKFLSTIGKAIPTPLYRGLLKVYSVYARWRHRHAPETMANIKEFVLRRTPLDREAMRWRLKLLEDYDPRPVASRTRVPVHYLAGLVDPLVPWFLVRRWLRRNCPGYRGGKLFIFADHNVLGTRPADAAEKTLEWMRAAA